MYLKRQIEARSIHVKNTSAIALEYHHSLTFARLHRLQRMLTKAIPPFCLTVWQRAEER